jgi:antitoxin (DNA-binding transcriptional repressor) of toxin-antitoxin stability system
MKAAAKTTRLHGIREVKANLSRYIAEARKSPVIITNHGKPEAILFNVQGMPPEDVILFTSKEFQSALNYDRKKTVSAETLLRKYSKT